MWRKRNTPPLVLELQTGTTILDITNKASMIIVDHVPLWHGGASLGYIPESGIAGSQVDIFPIF